MSEKLVIALQIYIFVDLLQIFILNFSFMIFYNTDVDDKDAFI